MCTALLSPCPAHLHCSTSQRNNQLAGTAGFAVSAMVPVLWFADPALAICLALYIIYSWTTMAWEQIMLLTGKTAERDVLWSLTVMA